VNPLDAFWHLANFFAPAVFVGVALPLLARLLWRRELRGLALRPAIAWAVGSGMGVLVGGLVVFGRDGKLATYAAMLLACAFSLWWRGFRGR